MRVKVHMLYNNWELNKYPMIFTHQTGNVQNEKVGVGWGVGAQTDTWQHFSGI